MAEDRKVVLRVNKIYVSYGHGDVLRGVDLEVRKGELISLIGPNGAGKSTLMRAVLRLKSVNSGSIEYLGKDITNKPTERLVASGITIVPEGRGILPLMSVRENLLLGGYHLKDWRATYLDLIFEQFPVLEKRLDQLAGTLSGGEQQMLSIARALIANPRLLLMDEPSLGLAPVVVRELFDIIRNIKSERDISILLSEQNARKALEVADRAYVIELGKISLSGTAKQLESDPKVRDSYLGLH